MTADELNAAIIIALVVAVLVGAGLWALADGLLRLVRVVRMAVRYRRDKHLRFDWGRAFRAARWHA